MKLKSLIINNFRAINGSSNKLQFSDNNIIFIFGKNDIGKSSVLHAYRYFSSPNQKSLITDFYDHNSDNSISIEATFIKEESDNDNFRDKGLNKWVNEHGEVRFRKTWSAVDSPAHKETFDPTEDKFNDGGFGGLEPILTNAIPNIIFIEAMPSIRALTDWLEKEIKAKILKKLKDNHEEEYSTALAAIKDLQEKVEGEDYLGEISKSANKYFGQTFPDLELKIASTPHKEADLSKAFEKDFSVTIGEKQSDDEEHLAKALEVLESLQKEELLPLDDVEEVSNKHSKFDLHGHGLIRQAIINILGIFKDTKDKEKHIILFEEPEIYLHPSNKRKFRDTLYKISEQDNYQIICVSHDPQIIDLKKPHTSLARFVKKEDGTTEIYQAGDDLFAKDEETKDRVLMLNRFNPHICEIFFSDDVILVEGDTEAIVLRGLLDTHYPEKEIFVLNTGTKNNMPFFIEALSHFKIKQHIIHDSDERFLYKSGEIVIKKDETPKNNSAWTLNQNIWDSIQEANKDELIAVRYVSIRNFEHSHGYSHDKNKGKPLSAYEFSKELDIEDNEVSIVNFLNQIVGNIESDVVYDPEYLENNVKEPF